MTQRDITRRIRAVTHWYPGWQAATDVVERLGEALPHTPAGGRCPTVLRGRMARTYGDKDHCCGFGDLPDSDVVIGDQPAAVGFMINCAQPSHLEGALWAIRAVHMPRLSQSR